MTPLEKFELASPEKSRYELAGLVNPNADSLGTPAEAYRLQCARRERVYFRLFAAGIVMTALAIAFLAGLNARNAEQPNRAGEHYRSLAAKLPEGGRRCEIEPHEGCLVCMSKIDGQPVVSTHC